MAISAVCVGFATSLLLQFVILRLLVSKSILDHPSHRSSHSVPTPRGGGIAVLIGFVVGSILVVDSVSAAGLVATAIAATLLGTVEDVRGLSPRTRFVLQLSASLPVVSLAIESSDRAWLLVAVVGILCLAGAMNAVNFMDGINGITAGVGIAAGISYSMILASVDEHTLSAMSLVLVAVCLAFLPFNAHRARVFLGDSGSYGLGAVLGSLALLAWSAGASPLAAAAPLAVYVTDTSLTLIRRWRNGEVLYDSHRSHVYQQLTDLGLSHDAVAALVTACVLTCGLLGAALAFHEVGIAVSGSGVAVVLALYVASPNIARRLRRSKTTSKISRPEGQSIDKN